VLYKLVGMQEVVMEGEAAAAADHADHDTLKSLYPYLDPSVLLTLNDMPPAARPNAGEKTGKFNYTVKDPVVGPYGDQATIEVQLKNRKFYMKKTHTGTMIVGSPTVSWSKYADIASAWADCKSKLGWVGCAAAIDTCV